MDDVKPSVIEPFIDPGVEMYLPEDVVSELYRCARQNGRIRVDYLLAIYRCGRAHERAALASRPSGEDDEIELRRFLWVNHGCPVSALYGDDGEMQCNATMVHAPIDFKREALPDLVRVVVARLQAARPSGEDAPRERRKLAEAEELVRELRSELEGAAERHAAHMETERELATLRAQLAEARDTIDTMKRQASDSMVMAMIEADRHVLREKLAAERTKAETLAREHAALVAVVRELIGSWRKKTPNYTAWDDAADELAAALLAHPLPDAPSGSGQP